MLPIRVINFGGKKYKRNDTAKDVELCHLSEFGIEACNFVENLSRSLPDCNSGYLKRYFAWFGEFDEFLYSDNDIVAVSDWSKLFEYLTDHTLVHADKEFATNGQFNFKDAPAVEKILGKDVHVQALTAGHFLCRKETKHIDDISAALDWMIEHANLVKLHDQTLLQVACIMGGWKKINLCRPPYNWGSSWHGDYKNTLDILQAIQRGVSISHIHYSGYTPFGVQPVEELLMSNMGNAPRVRKQFANTAREILGVNVMLQVLSRVSRKVKRIWG